MGGGGGVVNAIVDPIGSVASAVTGDKISLNPITTGKRELYDKPKQQMKDAKAEMERQQSEYNRAEDEFKKEQTEDKKKRRDLALQNLQRAQAALRGFQPRSGRAGTILTSPLGISSAVEGVQKTLLGY